MKNKSILLIYHFFYPDTVISARLFSELAEELALDGNRVTVFTGNRRFGSAEKFSEQQTFNGVEILRFSRPGFSQGSNFGRLFNSAILQLKWLWAFWKQRKNFDTVIIGTDPQFAYVMFPFLRIMKQSVRLIHWAFDLYPEAIQINSPRWMRFLASLAVPFLPLIYYCVDDMVDIGRRMRIRLLRYRHRAYCATLTPWALAEPSEIPAPDPIVREQLFGKAKLGLLYSGTVGYAHDLRPFVDIARKCRKRNLDIAFCFAGYGNQYKEQLSCLTSDDTNIRIAGVTAEKDLEKRLAAADIHLVSLRTDWDGIVVPSKFFGALAIGRPVIFSGPSSSDVALWLNEHQIGYHLNEKTIDDLEKLSSNPQSLAKLKEHAFECYHHCFAKNIVIDGWKKLLKRRH